MTLRGQARAGHGRRLGIGAAVARGAARRGRRGDFADLSGPAASRTSSARPAARPRSTCATRQRSRAATAGLDVLVNCAGIGSTTNAPETTLEVWENVFAVNARGTFLCCKHAIPGMAARGGGCDRQHRIRRSARRAPQPRRVLRVEGRRGRADARARRRPRRRRHPRQRGRPGHRRLAVGAAARRGRRRVARRAARAAAHGPARRRRRRSPRPSRYLASTPPSSSPAACSSIDGGLTPPA